MLPPWVLPHRLILAIGLIGSVLLAPAARGEEPVVTDTSAVAEPAVPGAAAVAPADAPDLAPRVQQLEEQVRRLQETIQRLLDERAAAGKPVAPADVQKLVDEQLKKQKPLAGWQDGF